MIAELRCLSYRLAMNLSYPMVKMSDSDLPGFVMPVHWKTFQSIFIFHRFFHLVETMRQKSFHVPRVSIIICEAYEQSFIELSSTEVPYRPAEYKWESDEKQAKHSQTMICIIATTNVNASPSIKPRFVRNEQTLPSRQDTNRKKRHNFSRSTPP